MFAARYFSPRYFGGRYFGHHGSNGAAGYYWGSRYFGKRFYGRRFFASPADTSPFTFAQTNVLACTGIGGLSGDVPPGAGVSFVAPIAGVGIGAISGDLAYVSDTEFFIAPPLLLPTGVGVGALAGSIVIGFPTAPGDGRYFGPRYFGSRFFGPRYWSTYRTYEITQTNVIAGVGQGGLAGQINVGTDLAFTAAIAGNGSGTIAGDLVYESAPVVIPFGPFVGSQMPGSATRSEPKDAPQRSILRLPPKAAPGPFEIVATAPLQSVGIAALSCDFSLLHAQRGLLRSQPKQTIEDRIDSIERELRKRRATADAD
jgi:hypothetical protein